MDIESVRITDLVSDPNNARKHDEKNLEAIKGSLTQFGQRKPIVVQGNVVIAGNGTLEAAKRLGWDEIDIVQVPEEWTKDQAKAFALADNRTAELAGWDEMVLAAQVIELKEAGFEVAEFGFAEIEPEPTLDTDEDELPEPPENPVAKLGDIWKLGNHRVMCGDSSDISSIKRLLDGAKVDLVFTDPPYRYKGMTTTNSTGALGKNFNTVTKRIADIIDFDPRNFLSVLPQLFEKGMNAYIFCNTDLVPDYIVWAKENGYNFNILTWHKTVFIPATNGHHFPDTEYLIYISKNAVWNNGQDANYGKYWVLNNEKHADHPTIKPLEIIADEIKISSTPNGVVVDLFGGSGSTLITCEQLGRKAHLMELSPQYVDVIIKRWENLTGEKAELVNV